MIESTSKANDWVLTAGVEVKFRTGRTITVNLRIDAIRGGFHAQQGWNGYMSGRWR